MTSAEELAYSTRTTRDAYIAVCAALAFGALAFGGVHSAARLILAFVAVSGLVWTWVRRARQSHGLTFGLMGWGFVIAMVWTLFQWVPLPMALVEIIAPHSAEATRAAAAAGEFSPPDWLPISLSPTRTAMGGVTLAAYAAVYFLAADITRHGWGRLVVLAIEAVALAVLGTALFHAIFGLQAIYGLENMSVDAPFVTSFVNPKHAGALMMMGAVIALGRWLQAEARYHLAIAAILCAGVAATGARSNLGVMVASGLFLVFFAQRRQGRRRMRWLEMMIVFSAFTTLALAIFPGVWSDSLTSAGRWRSEIAMHWEVATHVAAHQWWVGIGLEAFHTIAAQHLPSFEAGLLDHAHSLPLQGIADWGVPVALGVSVCFIAGFFRAVRVLASNLSWVAAATALIALCVQNLIDFSIYIPGVGLCAVALAGVISGAAQRRHTRDPNSGATRAPNTLTSIGVGVLCLATLTMSFHLLGHDRKVYESQAAKALRINMPRTVDVATMTTQHPSDFYIFRLAARLALADQQAGRALGFLDRAAALAPRHAGVRFDLARTAVAMNALVTAVDHLAVGAQAGPRARARAAEVVSQWPVDSVAMAQFLSRSSDHAWGVVRHLQLRGRTEKALEIGMRALRFHRNEPRIWVEVVGLCALRRDLSTLETLREEALHKPPGTASRWAFIGHWSGSLQAYLSGRIPHAVKHLNAARAASGDADASYVALMEALLAHSDKRWAATQRSLERVQRPTLSPALRVFYHRLMATLAEHNNQISTALAHLHQALSHVPKEPATLRAIEELETRGLNPP